MDDIYNIERRRKERRRREIRRKKRIRAVLLILCIIIAVVLGITIFASINGGKEPQTTVISGEQSAESAYADAANADTAGIDAVDTDTVNTDTANAAEDLGIPDPSEQNDLLEIIKEADAAGGEKTCYLTFDDGPSANVTPRILDTLRKYNIKATFFQMGASIAENTDMARRVYEAMLST